MRGEAAILRAAGPRDAARLNHIGSSAVPGLVAKPIVDILLEIDASCNVTELQRALKTIGYGEELATGAEDPFVGKGDVLRRQSTRG